MTDSIGLIAGFVLTLMVFSYVLGDNILYRLAVYVLVGLTAGFVSIVTVESVLLPWFRNGFSGGNPVNIVITLIPVLLATLLLFKTSSRLGRVGNLAMAVLVGVGGMVALVGAISGTLIPMTLTTGDNVRGDALNTIILFLGVIATLLYFQYTFVQAKSGGARRQPLKAISGIGQAFIVVTFATLYAGAILTSLTIFTERISFLLIQVTGR